MNYYKTRETSIATLLIFNKIPYVGLEQINEKSYYFVFQNPEECYRLEKKFLEIKADLLDQISKYDQISRIL